MVKAAPSEGTAKESVPMGGATAVILAPVYMAACHSTRAVKVALPGSSALRSHSISPGMEIAAVDDAATGGAPLGVEDEYWDAIFAQKACALARRRSCACVHAVTR
jgi:hypothetical protein